ncbi:MAG: hypothetical protein H0W73_06475 [Bacteroidetes bacterium]|nr:hypothetical protein [Bacteroidota bacterium]
MLVKNLIKLGFVLLFVVNLISCRKEAGEGGTSTIKGKIWVEDWNNAFTIKNGEYAGYDEDVYILYGDAVSYSEKTKTNYNGEFEFKYLRKGKYKIYVYSKDNTLQSKSGNVSVLKEVEITGKKQTKEVEQITIYN